MAWHNRLNIRQRVIIGCLPIVFAQALHLQAQQDMRVVFKTPKMGSELSITCFVNEEVDRLSLESGCWALVDSLNGIFSDYLDSSEISEVAKWSGQDSVVGVSKALWDLLNKSYSISVLTEGAFDVTIGPLTQLWRRYLGEDQIPPRRKVRRARKQTGYKMLHLDTVMSGIYMDRPGMRFDFGGIAKGYIGDCLALHLETMGIDSYLIDMGGDLIAGAPPPGKQHWKLRIPWTDQIIGIAHQAVATSGPDYQFFVYKDKRYAHIIDPETGWGVAQPFSSTVVAGSGWKADAMASALAVMPASKSISILEQDAQMEGIFGLGDKMHTSSGFEAYVIKN